MTRSDSSSSDAVWTATDLAGNPHEAVDKPERVRAMFAAIAGRYDLNNRLHSFGRDQAWRRKAVALAGVGPGDRVLDVACGTGDLTEAIARARPASVIGVDFTEPMLDRARLKATRQRRRPGVPVPEYRPGDAMRLPFGDASFDVVSIAFGIRNVDDPARALREFRRVLGPGGRVVVLEFSEPRHRLVRGLSALYTRHVMPVTASWIAGDRSGAYRYLPRSVRTFADRPELAAMIERVGFARVGQHEMDLGICTAYLGHVDGGGPEDGPGRGEDSGRTVDPAIPANSGGKSNRMAGAG